MADVWVLKAEAATGISRHVLRPDLYPEELDRPTTAKPGNLCWSGNGFRKPVQDETGASAEIAQRISKARPVRAPEPV